MKTSTSSPASAARRAWRTISGAIGLAASLACGISMVLAAAGVGGTAAATGMAAMTGRGAPQGVPGVLLRIGPWLLVVSVLLVTAAFALGRRLAAIPAVLAGACCTWACMPKPTWR